MAGCLGAIPAGGHVTPAAAAIFRAVEEDPSAARVAAAAYAAQFTRDERVGGIVHDRHHQRSECVATRDEVARVLPGG